MFPKLLSYEISICFRSRHQGVQVVMLYWLTTESLVGTERDEAEQGRLGVIPASKPVFTSGYRHWPEGFMRALSVRGNAFIGSCNQVNQVQSINHCLSRGRWGSLSGCIIEVIIQHNRLSDFSKQVHRVIKIVHRFRKIQEEIFQNNYVKCYVQCIPSIGYVKKRQSLVH